MGDVTLLLEAIRAGRREPAELVEVVYEELRDMARGALAREGGGKTLQTTDLVHEAYMRLLAARSVHAPAGEAQTPSPGSASAKSTVELTVKVAAASGAAAINAKKLRRRQRISTPVLDLRRRND